jgi:hypothetical protein
MSIKKSPEEWRTQALLTLQELHDTAPNFNAQSVIEEAIEAVRFVIVTDAEA